MNTDAAFNSVAHSYDTTFTFSETGRLQRERTYYFLEKILGSLKSHRILEINCGTGEDAILLAGKGHKVMATDASGEMIAIAESKPGNQDTKFRVCAFNELIGTFSEEKFDLIFSNFGGLNCVSKNDMAKLSDDFSSLLNTSGKLIAVVMGRKCLWEIFYFILKFDFKNAFRRSHSNGVEAHVGNYLQRTFYYSPHEFRQLYSVNFISMDVKPIGITLPPSYMELFFKKRKGFLNFLQGLERLLPFSFLSNLADHYFIVLEKKSEQ